MSNQKTISPQDLICMDSHSTKYNYRVELAYAQCDNLLFGEAIYHNYAKLWLYKDLAEIVFIASSHCFKEHNIRFILYDGLRTTDAQEFMVHTNRVKENPQWMDEPCMLSPTGSGGHPRGMAIDIGLKDCSDNLLNMGSAFDNLSKQAHREYNHSPEIMKNREILNSCMDKAAKEIGTPLLMLPQEWWDFRLPHEIYGQYAPLSDSDLPEHMRLTHMKHAATSCNI